MGLGYLQQRGDIVATLLRTVSALHVKVGAPC